MLVVDDLVLLAVLTGSTDAAVVEAVGAAAQGELFTTGCWYWRLARAVQHPGRGVFSRYLAGLDDRQRLEVQAAVERLPARIRILSLDRLVPVMAALPGQLNMLTAEAVAAAVVLDGKIVVTVESELLTRAARMAGVPVQVITVHG